VLDELSSPPILPFKKLAIVVVVHERGVYVGDGQLWELANDLFRRHAPKIMPDMDIPYSNPRACDTWLAPADARIGTNMASLHDFAMRCVHLVPPELGARKPDSRTIVLGCP